MFESPEIAHKRLTDAVDGLLDAELSRVSGEDLLGLITGLEIERRRLVAPASRFPRPTACAGRPRRRMLVPQL